MSINIYNQNGFSAEVQQTQQGFEIVYRQNGGFLEKEIFVLIVEGTAVKFATPNAVLSQKSFNRTTLINHCREVLAKHIDRQRVKQLIDAAWDELYRPNISSAE